jgi:alkyl hydroperoxide reductase subunit AhpC
VNAGKDRLYIGNNDFATKQLLSLSATPVAVSIDPFFFHLHWHEDEQQENGN